MCVMNFAGQTSVVRHPKTEAKNNGKYHLLPLISYNESDLLRQSERMNQYSTISHEALSLSGTAQINTVKLELGFTYSLTEITSSYRK